jgi:hypothetical protein
MSKFNIYLEKIQATKNKNNNYIYNEDAVTIIGMIGLFYLLLAIGSFITFTVSNYFDRKKITEKNKQDAQKLVEEYKNLKIINSDNTLNIEEINKLDAYKQKSIVARIYRIIYDIDDENIKNKINADELEKIGTIAQNKINVENKKKKEQQMKEQEQERLRLQEYYKKNPSKKPKRRRDEDFLEF